MQKTEADPQIQFPTPGVGVHVEIQRQVPMFQKVKISMSLLRGPYTFVLRTRSTGQLCETKVYSFHVF